MRVKNEMVEDCLVGPALAPEDSGRPMSRRGFLGATAVAGFGLSGLRLPGREVRGSGTMPALARATAGGVEGAVENSAEGAGLDAKDEILKEKIRRARLSGPAAVTRAATVAEMDAHGNLTVLEQGTNEWVCMPGDENIIGDVPMALDPMGMQWYKDARTGKPKPTNAAPGLIYMLCGATQRSYTDPRDSTSPAIPIGPHWMVLWPFDAAASGLPTVMRDAGTMIMFAGTPYAHLHICGSPLDGNEYAPGDRGVWEMKYARP
ncbi:MAG TPA: hypothetical protein VGD60_00555 [Candidatus Acidoferrales bacterium]